MLAAIVGLIFANLVGGGISRPVRQLLKGTQAVEAGHLDQTIDVTTVDEIGQLAAAFSIIGVFDQNGFKNIRRGAPVKLVFANRPGEVFYSEIGDVPRGTGQGQVAVSGTLARAETVGTSKTYPTNIDTRSPREQSPQMRLSGRSNSPAKHQ